MKEEVNYFLISVSNRHNLELCIEYAMAGFTNSINGLWTYLDIDIGDYISFIYGARVWNLYRVVKKAAYKNAENLPPWPPVTFTMSGNTYYFPFRLFLEQIREFNEPMVRPEFSYVAENLLLRGGYRKTHFQADTITFHNASQMGCLFKGDNKNIELNSETFEPMIVFKREKQEIPYIFFFKELILQVLVRKKLKKLILKDILENFQIDNSFDEFEVLGEKGLPEGFVDIFIKLKHPKGTNKYLLVEIKTNRAQESDKNQLIRYINEFRDETIGGILIAKEFSKSFLKDLKLQKIIPVKYSFDDIDEFSEYSYKDLLNSLKLEVIK